jgi:hypothetical protein
MKMKTEKERRIMHALIRTKTVAGLNRIIKAYEVEISDDAELYQVFRSTLKRLLRTRNLQLS